MYNARLPSFAENAAVVIRGVPGEQAAIENNWFYQKPDDRSIQSDVNTSVRNNVYGLKTPVLLAGAEPYTCAAPR